MPITPSPYQAIQNFWQNPPNGRRAELATALDAFDAMAEMEQRVLGFLDPLYGLQYSYGARNLPEALPGKYPTVIHLPVGRAALNSITTMGANSLVAHPGGTRHHKYPFQIFWIVGSREKEIKRLMAQSQFWCKAVDMAYCANGGLGGLAKGVMLSSAWWGTLDWGDPPVTYFGWVFDGVVTLQYTMQGGG